MTDILHVFVDATAIPQNRGGVGRYLEGLLPALSKLGVRLTIATQAHDVDWMRQLVPAATIKSPGKAVSTRPLRLLWEQFGMPRAARKAGATVTFGPHYTMPLLTRLPRVVAFHDATFFSHPELHGRLKRVFFRMWIKLSLRRVAVGLASSAATRDELVARASADPDRLLVSLLGVERATFHQPKMEELDDARDLVGSKHWIAFLGTLEPRKNVRNLVRAFPAVLANPAVTKQFPGLVLALIGGAGWDSELDAVIAGSPAALNVRRLGYVSSSSLRGLLGGSSVVAYPSIAEGFGLPVVEALACGAPVLTTRALSLPEVGGDVAYYTEPDADSIAAALIGILTDPDRVHRGKLGVARAAEFTWDRTARIVRNALITAHKGAT
ncbi:MAG: glycosyltransferase family 4 protein [Cryobacterium sp.]|nr:glycosyltransferase family 4 protein [Cryobacterium sp.]